MCQALPWLPYSLYDPSRFFFVYSTKNNAKDHKEERGDKKKESRKKNKIGKKKWNLPPNVSRLAATTPTDKLYAAFFVITPANNKRSI